MNSVNKNELTFQNFTFTPVLENDATWLTSTDLAKVLGYKKTDAISQIYSRNSDEFSESMSMTLQMRVNGINNSLRNKMVRVYSLRGAHLIAMFATTDKAKEFRRWVLDILDREVAQGNVNPAFDFEMHARNAQTSLSHITYIHQEWCSKLRPALRALGSPLAIDLEDRIKAVGAIAFGMERALSKQNKKGMIH